MKVLVSRKAGDPGVTAKRSVGGGVASVRVSPQVPGQGQGDFYRFRVEGGCGTKLPGASMQLPYLQIKER